MNLKKLGIALGCAVALVVTPIPAAATPIVYEAQLFDGVPVVGVNGQSPQSVDNPEGANYFSFFALAGSAVTLTGGRISFDFDMAFWLFEGLFADTSAFGATIDDADPGFVLFGDDEVAHAGPFGDPQRMFFAPSTGFYTVIVVNFLSPLESSPPYEFQLQADGVSATAVPESASLILLGTGLAALAFGLRRRKTA